MKVGRPKALARWVSWFFGLCLLAAVVMFATHHSQEMAFAQLMLQARPEWLLVALLLQMGTYITDARIWQRVLWYIALREFPKSKGKWGYFQALHRSKDPSIYIVLLEY